MFGWGPLEMVLVIFVVLLFFGAKRIPDALGSLGRGMREFKHAVGDKPDDAADAAELPAAPHAVPRSAPPAAPHTVPDAPHVAAAPFYDPTDPITPLRSLGDPLAPPPPPGTPADAGSAAKPSPESEEDATR
jgi:sec-independent protein translocase protein TatA